MPEAATAGAPQTSPASRFAALLLTSLIDGGVREIVVSPGSRSQSLALAAHDMQRRGLARVHVRIDERSAGYLAVGLAAESARPVAIITTSGTAVANLHPALLEAHYSGLPLIALTADRPEELHGIGANQTMRQAGLFGYACRLSEDVAAPTGATGEDAAAWALGDRAVAAALGTDTGLPGPVQLNIAFREPLSGTLPELGELLAAGFGVGLLAGTGAVENSESAGAVEDSKNPGAQADAADLETAGGPVVPSVAVGAIATAGASDSGEAGLAERLVDVIDTASPTVGGKADELPGVPPAANRPSVELEPGPLTVVVAGAGAGEAAEEFARRADLPLIAEVVSGARFGPCLVAHYRELLAAPEFGGRVQRAVVFGHPSLSREIVALLTRPDVDVVVVSPNSVEPYNPGRDALIVGELLLDTQASYGARDWIGRWVHAARKLQAAAERDTPDTKAPDVSAGRSYVARERLDFVKGEMAAIRTPIDRRMLVETLWRFTWPHDRLVFGASRLVRVADRYVRGRKVRVHANRGLSGIDGTIATGIGVAYSSQYDPRPVGARDGENDVPGVLLGVTRVLLGDIAFLHDVGSLLTIAGEAQPHVQVIVGNDGGGSMFDELEVAETADREAFDRVMFTPHEVNIKALSEAYGIPYQRAVQRGELDGCLSAPPAGLSLLEVVIAR